MSGWFSKRLAPPAEGEPHGRNLALEGLRGGCACLVLYAHMTMPFLRLDPAYAPSPKFWWFNLGSVAVLFFFVLSGYVIGLTTEKRASGSETRSYLGRRALRLGPINTAAVLLAWALLPQVGGATVLGNLFFLQHFKDYPFGIHVEVMPDNLNLWSLNFEALYYLAFLGIWWRAPRLGWVLCLLAAIAASAEILPGTHIVASSYAYGALYWMAGLSVAWLAPRGAEPGNWPSALLAIVVLWPLAPLQHFLFFLHLPDRVAPLPLPSLHRLDLLPAFLWLLLAVTGRGGLWRGRLALGCLLIASAGLVRAWRFGDGGDPGSMVCYSAAVVLSWLLLRWRPRLSGLVRLAPLGALSFGIYAVGFPVEFGLFRSSWLPMGTAWSFLLRAVLLVVITVGVAWILERKLQPALRRWLRPKRAGLPPPDAGPSPKPEIQSARPGGTTW